MIYFDNVSKKYPDGTPSLEGIMLSVTPGEFISIVGHSGAGKTTLTKLILAEESPTKGTVFLSLQIYTNFQTKSLQNCVAE